MADRPRFRRRDGAGPPVVQPRLRAMAAMLLLCLGMLAARGWLLDTSPPAPRPVVEVRGEVPRPGFYEAASLHDALRAAGADPTGQPDAQLQEGTAVVVTEGGVQLSRMDDLLVFGLPIDVNTASSAALQAIPGIGEKTAASILADRSDNGRFDSIEDLQRVRGIGPATVERLRPFVQVD
jgi:competence protein ComEA